MAASPEIEKLAREMAAKAQHDYARMYAAQLREHAHRWKGVCGEKALNDFATIIENVDGANP